MSFIPSVLFLSDLLIFLVYELLKLKKSRGRCLTVYLNDICEVKIVGNKSYK